MARGGGGGQLQLVLMQSPPSYLSKLGGGASRGSGGGSCQGSGGGVFLPGSGGGLAGGQGGIQPGVRGGRFRVRVTELVEPLLVL